MLQIFLVFFLWDAVFSEPGRVVFGYDRTKILTYIFGLLIVRAFVLSARTVDVAGNISSGDLSNYLLKPMSFFKYWITRDFSSKALNLVFAVVETAILYILLKPPFFIQTNPLSLFGFLLAILLAISIFFLIVFITSAAPFWAPEIAWGAQFLVIVIVIEFLSGALFPLNILPGYIQNVLYLTPFPYLIYFPLQIYLGSITGIEMLKGIIISSVWVVILWYGMNMVWKRGLRLYQAHGR